MTESYVNIHVFCEGYMSTRRSGKLRRRPRTPNARNRSDASAGTVVFRVADWPMAHFVQMERMHQRNATRILEPWGLPHREWRILALLSEHGAIGINQIAEQAGIERTTASKMLDRLEAKGLLARVTSEDDQRTTPVTLTAQGKRVLAATIPRIQSLFEQYRRGMAAGDYATLMQLLLDYREQIDRAGRQPDKP